MLVIPNNNVLESKKQIKICFCYLLFGYLILFSSVETLADDWPQWRGPNRDGISSESISAWSGKQPKEVWRKTIGEGFSAISVVNGRAYTMDTDGTDEFVVCLETGTGDEIWRVRSGAFYEEKMGGNGPRSTPVIDGDLLYVVSAVDGRLLALNIANGDQVWSVSMTEDFGSKRPTWGYSMSPVIDGDQLITEVGGKNSVVAFNKINGDMLWQSSNYKLGYSSPIVINNSNTKQAILFTASGLVSLNPKDGQEYWKYDWETSYQVNAATPVVISDNRFFISSGYDTGAAVVQVHASTSNKFSVKEIWRNKEMKNHFATVVALDDYLYGFDNSILKCIHANSGELAWRKRGYGKGTLILAQDQLIILSDKGKLTIGAANPKGFKAKATAKVLSGRCWTMPTLANGKLYLRSMDEIVCLDLSQ